MANTNNPAGFYPLGQQVRARAYTSSAAIAKGDLVAIASGKVLPFATATHSRALGVAANAVTGTGLEVIVYDDPATEFVGQVSGTYVQATHDGAACDMEGTSSIHELNENANLWNGLIIKRQYLGEPESKEVGANSRVVFGIAKHALYDTNDTLEADVISESTAGSGVTIDGANISVPDKLTIPSGFNQPVPAVGIRNHTELLIGTGGAPQSIPQVVKLFLGRKLLGLLNPDNVQGQVLQDVQFGPVAKHDGRAVREVKLLVPIDRHLKVAREVFEGGVPEIGVFLPHQQGQGFSVAPD